MNWTRLLRSEIRKLTTTRMPWAFLAVLVVLAGATAAAVMFGTDMDGSKAFIATAADQRSLIAFGWNAMMISGLFGAVAVAREYGDHTVVPTFLMSPRRHRAVLAQLAAVALGGSLIGVVGAGLDAVALTVALPTTDYGFLIPAGGVVRVVVASLFAGAVGAVLGAGIGSVVRNTGGAVTGTFLFLVVAPPLIGQFASGAASWVPGTLTGVLSGVGHEVALPAAIAAITVWALVPAALGLVSVTKRDVV